MVGTIDFFLKSNDFVDIVIWRGWRLPRWFASFDNIDDLLNEWWL